MNFLILELRCICHPVAASEEEKTLKDQKEKKICQYDGCEKEKRARGFCFGHDPQKNKKICQYDGCEKVEKARGFCAEHDKQKEEKEKKICQYDGCEKLAQARGYCKEHDPQKEEKPSEKDKQDMTWEERWASTQQLSEVDRNLVLELVRFIEKGKLLRPEEDGPLLILIDAMLGGFKKYPDTCIKRIVEWNCVANFCRNSHLPLLVALLMNHPSTNWKSWKDAHSDILAKLSHYKKDNKQVKLMVNRIAFTGGSTAEVDFQKTLDAVHAIWPETEEAITKESFLSLSRDLMAVFGLDINKHFPSQSHRQNLGDGALA